MRPVISPGAERATLDAEARGGRPSDWLAALLADADGRPADAVRRLGLDLDHVRAAALPDGLLAGADVLPAARAAAVRLRGDPEVTSDILLLAVLTVANVSAGGLTADALERLLAPPAAAPAADAAFAPFEMTADPGRESAARVVDANLNRAREAFRVLDDYARFVRDEAALTGHLKSLRHALAAAVEFLPPGILLAARDTPGDVGTSLTAGGEYQRESPRAVAEVNVKRLQESLRSAEEFGKVLSAGFGREIEKLRYAVYSAERALLGAEPRPQLAAARVYVLLTGSQCAAGMDWIIAEAAAGGAGVFQLREKHLPDRELLALARRVREWTRRAGALFIVNDRPDIAKLAAADGVHLGQDDASVADARRVVGPDAIVGVSTHSVEQVRAAVLAGADYLGIGPTFPSTTKAFAAFPGLAFVTAAAAATSLPLFALGGVTPANVRSVAAAGGRRVAVSAAVTTSDDPRAVAAALAEGVASGSGDFPVAFG